MFGSNYNDHRVAMGYNPKSSTEVEWIFYRNATWVESFAWLPHRCNLTKRFIWLENAYRGTQRYPINDNRFIYEHRWHSYDDHVIWLLKKE